MDYFDFETIDSIINKYKSNIISRIEAQQHTTRDVENSCDLFCQVLDYSPRNDSEPQKLSKITIKTNTLITENPTIKAHTNLNLNLGKQSDDNDDRGWIGETNEKVKHSRFGRKWSSSGCPSDSRNIIYGIIEKAVEVSEKVKVKQWDIDPASEEDSEDDEYERWMQSRRKELDVRKSTGEANNKKRKPNNISSNERNKSRWSNWVSDTVIRVYWWNTPAYKDIEITQSDSILTLKEKIISGIISNKQIKLKHCVPGAFEIRWVDDEDEIPIMDFPPLEDNVNVIQSRNKALAFIEKSNYKEELNPKILGNLSSSFNIKVYLKLDKLKKNSKIIAMKREDTLKNVLEYLLNKDDLPYKNIDLYYFIEHSDKEEDMDNSLNLETTMNDLTSLEIDLFFKKFPDAPESVKYSQFSQIDKFASITGHNELSKHKDEDPNGQEYLFNDISAGLYQEFEVIKINKFKNKQQRVLGIDMYNWYNNWQKNKNPGLWKGLFTNKTKKPLRKIKDIVDCGIMDNKMWFIDWRMSDEEKDVKKLVYEVKDNNVRNEIVSKLKYLIKMNKDLQG